MESQRREETTPRASKIKVFENAYMRKVRERTKSKGYQKT